MRRSPKRDKAAAWIAAAYVCIVVSVAAWLRPEWPYYAAFVVSLVVLNLWYFGSPLRGKRNGPMRYRRTRLDWVVSVAYVVSVMVALYVTDALGLPWYVVAAYLAVSFAAIFVYYRIRKGYWMG